MQRDWFLKHTPQIVATATKASNVDLRVSSRPRKVTLEYNNLTLQPWWSKDGSECRFHRGTEIRTTSTLVKLPKKLLTKTEPCLILRWWPTDVHYQQKDSNGWVHDRSKKGERGSRGHCLADVSRRHPSQLWKEVQAHLHKLLQGHESRARPLAIPTTFDLCWASSEAFRLCRDESARVDAYMPTQASLDL